jgi:hypothetical protein
MPCVKEDSFISSSSLMLIVRYTWSIRKKHIARRIKNNKKILKTLYP